MKRRAALAVAVGLVFYALSDIALWQRIFEQHDLFQYEYQYQTGHVTTLVAMIAVGMILIGLNRWALWYAAAFYTLTFSGLEDILYYWLDGRSLPARMPWMDHGALLWFQPETVTSSSLLMSAAIWIGIWLASLWALPVAGRLVAAVSFGITALAHHRRNGRGVRLAATRP